METLSILTAEKFCGNHFIKKKEKKNWKIDRIDRKRNSPKKELEKLNQLKNDS